MPLKGGNVGALKFWESIALQFGPNDHVMYNLWRFPATSIDTYLNGTDQYASMPEMVTAVRKHAKDSVIIIQGLNQSREPESLKKLDKILKASNESLVMYGVWASKFGAGLKFDSTHYLERKVDLMKEHNLLGQGTDKPLIAYEFD